MSTSTAQNWDPFKLKRDKKNQELPPRAISRKSELFPVLSLQPPSITLITFKPETDPNKPKLDKHYCSEDIRSYLDQCFIKQGKIGEGSFGSVVSVISRADQTKKYAIKIANNEKQKPPRTEADWEKILREVRQNEILSSNSHPNIVQFYKAWTDNNILHLQMELCTETLSSFLQRQHKLEGNALYSFVIDILLAIKYLHSLGLLHLDIKPENIMVVGALKKDDRCWKVGDFGNTVGKKELQEMIFDGDGHQYFDIFHGDGRYLAPEAMKSRPTHKWDMYSFGMVLLEVATSIIVPWACDKNGHLLRMGAPFPDQLIQGVDHFIVLMIRQLMNPTPEQRPSASKLLKNSNIKARFTQQQTETFNKTPTQPVMVETIDYPIMSSPVIAKLAHSESNEIESPHSRTTRRSFRASNGPKLPPLVFDPVPKGEEEGSKTNRQTHAIESEVPPKMPKFE